MVGGLESVDAVIFTLDLAEDFGKPEEISRESTSKEDVPGISEAERKVLLRVELNETSNEA